MKGKQKQNKGMLWKGLLYAIIILIIIIKKRRRKEKESHKLQEKFSIRRGKIYT